MAYTGSLKYECVYITESATSVAIGSNIYVSKLHMIGENVSWICGDILMPIIAFKQAFL
jgi:hypothetical protein